MDGLPKYTGGLGYGSRFLSSWRTGAFLSPVFCDCEVPAVFSKIQVALCILAGVGIVVFVFGVTTNLQVKQFGPVSGLNGLLAWGSFGLVFASCIGVVVTQALEFREPKEPKHDSDSIRETANSPQLTREAFRRTRVSLRVNCMRQHDWGSEL